MHVAPRIVVHCCPLLSIVVYGWQYAPDVVQDMPQIMPQTCAYPGDDGGILTLCLGHMPIFPIYRVRNMSVALWLFYSFQLSCCCRCAGYSLWQPTHLATYIPMDQKLMMTYMSLSITTNIRLWWEVDLSNFQKHRKNCECCPGSFLIVR